jgi:hypothetical protein
VATNQRFSTECGDGGNVNENKKPWNEWWNDECRKAMEEKNLARIKCINRRTRINQNDYMQKRKTANCICKRKKKEWLNDKIK